MMISNKKTLTRGVALVAASAVVALTAVPAFADPVRPYSTVGSDTIQDVWNGLTNDATAVAPSIASYDSTSNGVAYATIHSKTVGSWFTRPNGSGDGAKAVCATWDTTGDPTHLLSLNGPGSNVNLNNQEVDFSRSSSGPATGTFLNYLPFARDAVSISYNTQPVGGAASGLPATLNLTTADITALYTGNASSDGRVTFTTSAGVAENPATTDATAKVFLDGLQVFPTLPQGSSGTRKFFANAAGISNTVGANAAYVSDAAGAVTGTGAPYEENSGRPLLNPGTLIPFSAAQWISQQTGAANSTLVDTKMAIASINGNAAVTGSGASAAQGPLFGSTDLSGNFNTVPTSGVGNFNRDTFNVIPASFASAGTPKQSALVSILTGGGTGQLNSSSAGTIIHKFGFGTLSYSTGTGSALPGGCASGY